MTAPRMPLFQRKGGASPGSPVAGGIGGKPSLVISIGHGQPRPEGSAGGPDSENEVQGEPVTCPECGCQFDPSQAAPSDAPPMDAGAMGMGMPGGMGAGDDKAGAS